MIVITAILYQNFLLNNKIYERIILSKALRGEINLSAKFIFKKNVQINDEFIYLISIESDEAILVNTDHTSKVKKLMGKTSKPFIEGSFWEENISWNFSSEDGKELNVEIWGNFAFELNNSKALDGLDILPGNLSSVTICVAPNAFSKRELGYSNEIAGGLISADEDDEFENL